MLWTIFIILIVLWLLGFIGHFGGGLIHLLLVIAVVVLIINLIQGRRPLWKSKALPGITLGYRRKRNRLSYARATPRRHV